MSAPMQPAAPKPKRRFPLASTGGCFSLKFEKVDEFSPVRTLGNWAAEPLAE